MQRLGGGIALLWSPGRARGNNVAPSSLLLSWFSRGSCLLLQAPSVHHLFQAAVPTAQYLFHFPGWVCPADFSQGLFECRDVESLTQLCCVSTTCSSNKWQSIPWSYLGNSWGRGDCCALTIKVHISTISILNRTSPDLSCVFCSPQSSKF